MGGPAHQVALLSGRRFFPQRYETLLVHGSLAPGEGSAASLAEEQGARMVHCPQLVQPIDPARDLVALVRLRGMIRRFRPHIVHTHTAKAGFVGRVAALLGASHGPRLVHTFHGHVLEGYFGPTRSDLYRRLERRLAARTDRLIGVSEATVADLLRLGIGDPARFRVIPVGIELDPFASGDQRRREPARRSLGLGPDQILCTFVGRIAAIKRIDLLLEAFATAWARDPRLRLLIVGDGEDRRGLERVAAGRGIAAAVHFAGYRSDLAELWSASDIAVLASANEGTPISLIEAAAAGVPAVSTDVGGVRETLAPGAAILVPPDRPGELAAGILDLAANPARRAALGALARQHALAHFGADRLLADVDALYRELMQAGGRSR